MRRGDPFPSFACVQIASPVAPSSNSILTSFVSPRVTASKVALCSHPFQDHNPPRELSCAIPAKRAVPSNSPDLVNTFTVSLYLIRMVTTAGLRHIWTISTVYAVPTSSAPLFFKASPDFFPAEAALTEDLSRRFPRNVPGALAADARRNWLLMADLGETSFEAVSDEGIWQEAMRLIASIQLDYSDRIRAMESLGLERKRPEELPARLARWARQAEGPGRAPGHPRHEARSPAQQMGLIEDLCAELASFAIPATLDHGDLDTENMFLSAGRPVLMDWSDSSISHPFFTEALLGREGLANGPRLDAYLRPWSAFGTEERLKRARFAGQTARMTPDPESTDCLLRIYDSSFERLLPFYAWTAVKSLKPWTGLASGRSCLWHRQLL